MQVVRVFRRHDSANSGLVTPEELHQIFTECKVCANCAKYEHPEMPVTNGIHESDVPVSSQVFISRRDLDSVLEAYDDFQTHPDSHGSWLKILFNWTFESKFL